ncbi:MAG: hydroxymethylglutaryl-CoA reductase, degradative [Nannocystaceae bacterium]|nr:hydroxymethylglutaryl-CoA reductase, degradative [bacterium]
MNDIPVSAPGKAFLIGEYAVLEGAPALVAALDVRAVAHRAGNSKRPVSAVVRCAHQRVKGYLEARGEHDIDPPPVVETGGFTMGARKLGLGSSAAVAASVIGYHLTAAGLDPFDPSVREDALSLALAAHAEAQGGGGSGADVAAAVLGGLLHFQDRKTRSVAMPQWAHIGFVDAGAPAVTSRFVAQVKAAAAEQPGAYADAIGTLSAAVDQFLTAFRDSPNPAKSLAGVRAATQTHNEGLRALAAMSGAPIMTPAIETIIAEAQADGLAAKPSGAGGGDLVVVIADSRADLDRFGERLHREHGMALLGDLKIADRGIRAEERVPTNSRLAGFFKLDIEARRQAVAEATGLDVARLSDLDVGALDMHRANHMIENVVGTLELPLAIATNFRINGRDFLVPMCVEEASVVAAASNAAKMIRAGGGFSAHSDPPWMIAQVQLTPAGDDARPDANAAAAAVAEIKDALLGMADAAHPRLVERGGGARDVEVRVVDPAMVVVHILVDCRDAMGANLLNTVAETVAPRLEAVTGWTSGLRILSNLSDRRCSHISARIPPEALAGKGFSGPEVVERIVSASRFAELDPYRATTHNKGIMNGVDAVVLATGNDWRAMEASAHAFAATRESPDGKGCRYGPLAVWRKGEDGWLEGKMSLPTAVGVVGGATRVHPVARLALEILGCTSGHELGQVIAAAGLASNLAACRALATEGIQRGHMSLHARSIALGAGASGAEVEQLAAALVADGEIKAERACALLTELRAAGGGTNPTN